MFFYKQKKYLYLTIAGFNLQYFMKNYTADKMIFYFKIKKGG